MEDHVFEGSTDELGRPIIAQVLGAAEGAMAQVCSICGKTAGEDGKTPDHLQE